MNSKKIIIVLFIFNTALCSVLHSQETIELSVIKDIPSFENLEEILHRAYSKLGINVNFIEFPGLRGLRYSNSGITNGEAFRSTIIEKTYSNLIRVNVTLQTDNMYIFVKSEKQFELSGWESIPNGSLLGYRRGIEFINQLSSEYEIETIVVEDYSQLFKLLELDRVDLIITGRIIGANEISKMENNDIVMLEPPIHESHLYHYLHKDKKDLVPMIEEVLREMKENGEFDLIKQEH